MQTVIGLDIGHSMVKAIALSSRGRQVVRFPSVVAPAIALSDEAAANTAAYETVQVGGKAFFTGNTAVSQGAVTAVTGLSQDWVTSHEHTALFASCFERLKTEGVPDVDKALVVMGLPSEFFKHQRDTLRDAISTHFSGDLVIQPQPAGPYYGVMFNPDGRMVPGRSMASESWAVIDVGHYTTDFLLVLKGQRIEMGLGSDQGVYVAIEHLRRLVRDNKSISIDALEASEALKTKRVANFGQSVDISLEVDEALALVVSRVIDKAEALISSHARKLDGVIVAGGGSEFVYPVIKEKWAHAIQSQDPRLAIADGFARYGRMLQFARNVTAMTRIA